jgi:hypothetical protein
VYISSVRTVCENARAKERERERAEESVDLIRKLERWVVLQPGPDLVEVEVVHSQGSDLMGEACNR